ncbi:hypothetical protein MRX96_024934 [Rhipicephalus microplus]
MICLFRTPHIFTITACCFLQYLRGQHHERLPRYQSRCAYRHCHSGAKYVPSCNQPGSHVQAAHRRD